MKGENDSESGKAGSHRQEPTIKISSVVDERAWEELKAVAAESHQNISGLLSEAIADCVRRRRIRPAVMENRTGTGPNRNRGHIFDFRTAGK